MKIITIFLPNKKRIFNIKSIDRNNRIDMSKHFCNRYKNIHCTGNKNVVSISYIDEYLSEVIDYIHYVQKNEGKIGIKTYVEQEKENITKQLDKGDKVVFL